MGNIVSKKQETKELAVTKENSQSWGDTQIDASDLIIPKLFTLNPMSKICKDDPKNYPPGSIIRSTDKKVLGDTEKKVSFIPFKHVKKWKIEQKVKSKFEFVSYEPFTHENANRPWQWVKDGVEMRANLTLDFYVLLKEDIANEKKALEIIASGDIPDIDDAMFPTVISFNRTSYVAGKLLMNHFAKAEGFKLNPAVSSFYLKSVLKESEGNSWFALDVEKHEKSDAYEVEQATKWHNILKQAKSVNVDEVDEEEKTESAPAAFSNDF